MKAKLYIDSEDSTIKVEGGPSDVLHLLVCAIAQILKSYFPDDFERQMGWVSGLLYNTIRELKEEDDDEDYRFRRGLKMGLSIRLWSSRRKPARNTN